MFGIWKNDRFVIFRTRNVVGVREVEFFWWLMLVDWRRS